ncbi:MAG: hypothetical protein ING84_17585 [Cytophagales bacterium]|jgi:hypothetical protein|nr:hypothetical protein [Cytophagales bacterium]MCA6367963.1 hypothetical protein [Cytophagales bacterium]MCA6371090.1 hypothetical protein [Cytophagales bacterium]MCA6375909.1 hypothetical protein [Cytophagales bacterium]MCA6386013.1 hypothetical protein [Cytophagales bacterium]
MAKKSKSSNNVDKINVRMYRVGTGDFFLLQFKKKTKVTFNLMIDCGCIHGGKTDFEDKVEDLNALTKGIIDLLIVTHEHADHINGFEKASPLFDKKLTFKKVWFAWTEADENFANTFRKEHAKIKMAVQGATLRLNQLKKDKAFDKIYAKDSNQPLMIQATNHFIESLNGLDELNYYSGLQASTIPTMEDILRNFKVIKGNTVVEFWEPGNVIENLAGAEGIRFLVLGPPKNNTYIKKEEVSGEGYEKRDKKSTMEMAFLNVFDKGHVTNSELMPFDDKYILQEPDANPIVTSYQSSAWRTIDHEWLFSAGSLALRHETSINNTSLAVAIQFTDSERVLLFPGDAEQGSWLSWHDNLEWSFKDKDNETKKVNAEYILNHTVFYKVGHHLSQNGTAKRKGLEMMKQEDIAAMATLDFKKINTVWLNTMPNDLIGEELIRKTKGKFFFLGDRKNILKNIKTNRVTISQTNLKNLEKWNKPFDGKIFIDYEVKG